MVSNQRRLNLPRGIRADRLSAVSPSFTVTNRTFSGLMALASGPLYGGTGLTAETAEAEGRPLLVADPFSAPDPKAVADWLAENRARVLNVAGSRESTQPGIHRAAADFLAQVLALTRRPS